MAEQASQARHDGEPQPQSLAAVARRIVQLYEFLKHAFQLVGRNAAAGIDRAEAYYASATATRHQNAPIVGVADRVGNQVGQNAFDQQGVAVERDIAGSKM